MRRQLSPASSPPSRLLSQPESPFSTPHSAPDISDFTPISDSPLRSEVAGGRPRRGGLACDLAVSAAAEDGARYATVTHGVFCPAEWRRSL